MARTIGPIAIGLVKVSFHSKERQCQRMFKVLYNRAHFTCYQAYAQNSSSYASTVREPRTSKYTSWVSKRQRNQRSNCQHSLDHRESKGIPEKNIYFCFIDYAKAFDCVDHNKLWKILQEMGIPDHLPHLSPEKPVCRSRRNRNGHRTTDWFKTEKGSMTRLYIVTLLI